MKKILFINHTGDIHGAETVMIQIMKNCINKQKKVYVVAPVVKNNFFRITVEKMGMEFVGEFPYKMIGFSFFHSLSVILYNFYTTFLLVKFVKKNKIEIIYSNTSPNAVGVVVSFFCNIPHLWHFHEPVNELFGWRKSMRYVYNLLLKNKNNKIVFISETQKREWKIAIKNNVVVYNPIKELKIKEIKQDNHLLTFGFAGVLNKRKNVSLLIESFFILKKKNLTSDLQLIIAGSGEELPHIQSLIKNLSLENVVIIDYLEDMNSFYSEIDILVLPSLIETWGLVALEAMSARKAVIVTANTGLHEIIKEGEDCLFIDPANQKSLLDAMTKMLEPDFRKKISENGYNKLMSYHFNDNFIRDFDILFDN